MTVWVAIGGNNMLLYLAALTNVPQELYEAADIDGAGQKMEQVLARHLAAGCADHVLHHRHAAFPSAACKSGFEPARVMTNKGGPAGTTTTLAYYIYIKAFQEFQMGYASAIAWTLFAIIFAITLMNWKNWQQCGE